MQCHNVTTQVGSVKFGCRKKGWNVRKVTSWGAVPVSCKIHFAMKRNTFWEMYKKYKLEWVGTICLSLLAARPLSSPCKWNWPARKLEKAKYSDIGKEDLKARQIAGIVKYFLVSPCASSYCLFGWGVTLVASVQTGDTCGIVQFVYRANLPLTRSRTSPYWTLLMPRTLLAFN